MSHDETDDAARNECCPGSSCGPGPASSSKRAASRRVDRRAFLALTTLGAAGVVGGAVGMRAAAAQALGVPEDQVRFVPADKGISKQRLAELAARGEPTVVSDRQALRYIGMPVGGILAGRVYLGGDGRLWLWDVNNPSVVTASYWEGTSYAEPLTPTSPFRQGVALRTTRGGTTTTRSLDSDGFGDVTFTGKYPIGQVDYHDEACPVDVRLEAFSPFVPPSVEDSSYPATVLTYTLTNTTNQRVRGTLAGWTDSPICLETSQQRPIRLRTADLAGGAASGFELDAVDGLVTDDPRPDILFEDFEKQTYEGWTVEGNAFGPGPVTPDDVPPEFLRFGDLNISGSRFATSYAFWSGDYDGLTGKLISAPFTIERRYITVRVGGGAHADETCVNLVVDGEVVASRTGNDTEPLPPYLFDVRDREGQTAHIEIVDANTGGWGHVNCDYIVFTDTADELPGLGRIQDNGTFAVAALDSRATVHRSLADGSTLDGIFDSGAGPDQIDASEGTLTGTVRVPFTLAAGASTTIRLVFGWHFPNPRAGQFRFLEDGDGLRHHYATRFDSAGALVTELAGELDRLEEATKEFVATWYDDSTLPYWFLERTLAPASTLATTTCYRFSNGRFYAQEGEYCCEGTCQHVWNYAQSIARLFPSLERDTRERVDLGIAFHADTGAMDYRAEAHRVVAVDGQAGTILRIYREHQMAPNDQFLTANWERIKLACQYLIGLDGEPDGILEGEQYNTLDQSWWGEIPWISGLYVAALRACAEMATEVGDSAFATRCTELAESGSAYISESLWNAEYGYFEHKLDPDHQATNSNRGCFADQMYGELYARQLDLPRVFPVDRTKTALGSVYTNNFLPDPAAYRDETVIEGGRWYALDNEPGLLMCTWPFGGDDQATGGGEPGLVAYFNEVWTGQEYQVGAHLLAEGLVDEGLAVIEAVRNRYDAAKRNPYNEIECSDHYARAMMSHAAYVSMTGFAYHGPRGHLGFAPKLRPEKFAAAFTAAEGWGSFRQRRTDKRQTARIEVRHGRLRLRTLALETATPARIATVRKLGSGAASGRLTVDGTAARYTLDSDVVLERGETLQVTLDL